MRPISVLALIPVVTALLGAAGGAPAFELALGRAGQLAEAAPGGPAAAGPPSGLAAADWAQIREHVEAQAYRAEAAEDSSYVAANPAHGFAISYLDDGTTRVQPRAADPDWTWGLKLHSYGRGVMNPVDRPLGLAAVGSNVTYTWDDNVSEWWMNGANGLEQGFTVRRQPNGLGPGEALEMRLGWSGDLKATAEGDALAFSSQSGSRTLTYSGLRAWDATGRELRTRLALAGKVVSLRVEDAGAVYPVTIDPWVQQAYLKASNTGANDEFGFSVAVSGNTVVVGAYLEDSNATGVNGNESDNSTLSSGAAYVFVWSGTTWNQQAYLKASNPGAGDLFGYSVALSGDTVVVGAYGEDSNATGVNGNQSDDSMSGSGAAYVFIRSGTTWSQQAYLKASNTSANDFFGRSVAVSGDTVLVGAYGEDSNATGVNGNQSDNTFGNAGAAYVFVRSGTTWAQEAYLKASNTGADDQFGCSVAVSGDTAVVGANSEDSNATGVNGNQSDNSSVYSGAAYVFVRSGMMWSQEAYLKASNTGIGDYFGESVAVSVDTVLVGAYSEDSNARGVNGNQSDNSYVSSGAAYVFVRGGAAWSQQAYLKASNTGSFDLFGFSVAVAGDTVVVGAHSEASNSTGVNGNQLDNSSDNSGAAYVFVRSGTAWSQQAYLKAANTGANDFFGRSVAVSGDSVVVGAEREDSNALGVNGNQADNSSGDSGAAYVYAVTFADLSITVVDTPDPVTAGDNLTYTVTVTNAGPSAAATLSLADTLPAGTSFVSLASPGGWSCTTPVVGAGGAISCTAATLATGNAVFTLVVAVDPTVAAGTVLSNAATVSSATNDPSPGDESATANTTVAASANLSITKVDASDPVTAGNNLTYTVTVTNAGPSAASTLSLADTLPAGTTFVSLASPGGWSCTTPAVGAGGAISCTLATFAPGNAVFTLVVAVDPAVAAGTVLSNTATVSSATTDPSPGDESATATTTVAASANLSITKVDTPDPVTAGNNLTYTLTLTNAGPSAASTLSLVDTLPAGTTFVSLASPGSWSCSTPAVGAGGAISCTVATLAPGNAVFTLVVAVDPTVAAGTVLSNTATVSSATTDPSPGDESATATTTVAASANLSITKVDASDPVAAGNSLTYTVTVTNAGPSAASTLSLADTLPAGTTFVSLASPGGWSCTTPAVGASGAISCTAATLAPGNAVFTLVVAVDPTVAAGTVLSNTATVSSVTIDPSPGDESATATTTVAAFANLSITKVDTSDPVIAGNNLTYTVTVTNAGPSAASTLSFADTLPSGTTFVSLASPGGWSCTTPAVGAGGAISCTMATLAPGNAVFTLVVAVDPSVAAGVELSNTATVSSATTDPSPGDESATATTTVATSADVSISKVGTPDPVMAGNILSYALAVANAGPSAAATPTLADTMPAGTTFLSLAAPGGWSCSTPAVGASGAISCSLASLAVGSANFTLLVAVDQGLAGGTVLTNTATVTVATSDPDSDDHSASANTTVVTYFELPQDGFETGDTSAWDDVMPVGLVASRTPTDGETAAVVAEPALASPSAEAFSDGDTSFDGGPEIRPEVTVAPAVIPSLGELGLGALGLLLAGLGARRLRRRR